jgi:hypothetical protein
MSSNNKTSLLIKSQVPAFVRDEHERFVEFMEYYYKFLERDGQLNYVTKNFPRFLDIDEIKQDIDHDALVGEPHSLHEENDYHAFLQKLYDNFTALIPDSILADKVLLLKHAKEFYRSRGSEKSIRFLMRALYNEEVEFYYPKNDILRASDGKWFVEKSLNVKDFAVNNVANASAYTLFRGRSIRGANSNSTCTVEAADQYYDNGVLVTELKVSAVEQDFENGEKLFTFFEEEGEVKHLSCNLFSGIIISATVTSAGSGYIQGAGVPIESNSGSGGIIIISKVAKANLEGKIKSVTVTLPGAGFRVNDQLLFTGGGGKNAAAIISSVNDDESFHPSSYNVVGSRISDVANVQIANTIDLNESFSYTNLATLWTNTSNLTISTIPGSGITEVTLSHWGANSNVYFETGDIIVVSGTDYTIVESARDSTYLKISPPGLPGSQTNLSFDIRKKPNANTTLSNSMVYWTYGPCGPIVATAITNPGSNYFELPTLDVLSNNFVRSFGILGRMEIIDGGIGYQTGDIIEFINQYGDYGEGANGVVTVVDANGTIQQVAFYPRDGFNTGGAGYSMLSLPIANVVTTTGSNANVMVTAIIGDGELLEATSNVIGSIERLRVLSGGAGYLTNPTINLKSQGDGTAQAFANIVTGIYTYPGRYINDDGHLSGYNFIQDRDYYQPYSYVIKSDVSLSRYRKSIKELSHPAGMLLFGQHVYSDDSQNNVFANVVNTIPFTTDAFANLVLYFDVANSASYIPSGNFNVFTYDARTGTSNTAANVGNVYYDRTNVWYNSVNANSFATLTNNAHFRASGVQFNGVYANDSVTLTHGNAINTASVMTFVTWFNSSNTNGNKYIASKVNGANNRGFRMFIQDSSLKVSVGDSTTSNIITIGTVNSNAWYQAAFTFEGINIRGYMNGEFKVVSTGVSNANTDSSGDLYLGTTNGFKPNTFQGKIAMAQIYNKRLSNTEILREFNAYRRRFGI